MTRRKSLQAESADYMDYTSAKDKRVMTKLEVRLKRQRQKIKQVWKVELQVAFPR